ncbi:hypothetical protein KF707_01135 [Candidatus Obscuribacterales bacterium]|nr:hypothetical protein [Candidatus Obscuribacterales bacterium]
MRATNGAARVFSGVKGLSVKVVRLSLIVSVLSFANPAQAAVVKKPQASKPAQKFDLKRITAAAAKAPAHRLSTAATTSPSLTQANSNQSIASIAGTSSLSSSAEIEKQFQQLKKNGFKGNPSIELLERMMGEMHNQKRWADKEIVMRANVVAYEKHYGADHPVVASQLESMIDMYKKLNKLSDASKLQTRVISILKGARENIDATPLFDVHSDGTTTERSPMTHEDRMADLRTRADVFANHADYETSAAYLKKALSESKSEGGGFTSDDFKTLASFEERLGNEKEAAKFRNDAETTN